MWRAFALSIGEFSPGGVFVNIPETFFPARVLLVDDEHHQLQLRACFLRMAGFPVLTAQGPLDALSLVRTIGELDVAIVDYEMPVMNGGVLAQHLKRKFPKLNVVLYSAAVLVPFCDLNSIDAFIPKGEGITVLLHHMWNLSAEV